MTGRTSHLPPAPRELTHSSDIWLSLGVAVALGLAAVTIALWPSPDHAETAAQVEIPTVSAKVPLSRSASQVEMSEDSPTEFTNPFDASEVFEFPPGTTEDVARDSVAEILIERARERGDQSKTAKHAHPSSPLRIPPLVSKTIFKNAG